jgi:hypothetical protein
MTSANLRLVLLAFCCAIVVEREAVATQIGNDVRRLPWSGWRCRSDRIVVGW